MPDDDDRVGRAGEGGNRGPDALLVAGGRIIERKVGRDRLMAAGL